MGLGTKACYDRRVALLELIAELQGNPATPVAMKVLAEMMRRRLPDTNIYGALIYQDVRRLVTLGCLAKVEARMGGWAHTYVATGVPVPEVWAGHRGHREPEPHGDDGLTWRKCLMCKGSFRGLGSEHWCSATCGQLLQVADELLVRIERLGSEGIDVLLDVDLQAARRLAVVTTSRGRWEVVARKNETWEKLMDRALA